MEALNFKKYFKVTITQKEKIIEVWIKKKNLKVLPNLSRRIHSLFSLFRQLLGVELDLFSTRPTPKKRYVEVLIPINSECDIWKQGLYGGNKNEVIRVGSEPI